MEELDILRHLRHGFALVGDVAELGMVHQSLVRFTRPLVQR